MSVNRRLARSPRTMPQLSTAANTVESEHVCSNYPPIKHIPFPSQASQFQSDLINEWLLFAFSFWAAGLQFLHLYRTVWWLPDSYTNQTMVKFTFFFLVFGWCDDFKDTTFCSRTSISSINFWRSFCSFCWDDASGIAYLSNVLIRWVRKSFRSKWKIL